MRSVIRNRRNGKDCEDCEDRHDRHDRHDRRSTWIAFAALACLPLCMPAQTGSGSAAGAGSVSGASGPGAGQGQAGHGQTAVPGQTAVQNGLTPEQYAAGASQVLDPRKPPAAKPNAMTLQQVVEQARTKNPTILAAEQTLRSVRAQEVQAGLRANPYFTFYGTNVTLPGDGSEGNPFQYTPQLLRLFERGHKRTYRLETARATTAQTEALNEDQVRQTVLQVRTAFTHMLTAKQAAQLAAASLKDFRHEVEIANDRYQAGDLGKLDFERLDLLLGSYESDEANDLINLEQASAQLQTFIGYDIPKPDFDITGEVVPPIVTQTKAMLEQVALTTRPDYAATRYAQRAAEASSQLAIANGLTDPTLEVEYDRSGNYNSFGFSANIPIRIFDRNQGNKATARYQADASRFVVVAARNQVVSDVEQAWVGYAQSKRLSDRFTDHYLDESSDVLSIAQFAFEHGGIALIDYLDALRDARTAVSNALNAYSNTWLAIHQLSASTASEVTP